MKLSKIFIVATLIFTAHIATAQDDTFSGGGGSFDSTPSYSDPGPSYSEPAPSYSEPAASSQTYSDPTPPDSAPTITNDRVFSNTDSVSPISLTSSDPINLWDAKPAAAAAIVEPFGDIRFTLDSPIATATPDSLAAATLVDAPKDAAAYKPFHEGGFAPATEFFTDSPIAKTTLIAPDSSISAGDLGAKLKDVSPDELVQHLPPGADLAKVSQVLTSLQEVASANPTWTASQLHDHFYSFYSGDPMALYYYHLFWNNSAGQRIVQSTAQIRGSSRFARATAGGSRRAISTNTPAFDSTINAPELRPLDMSALRAEVEAPAGIKAAGRWSFGKITLSALGVGGLVAGVIWGWKKIYANESDVFENREILNPFGH